MRPNSTASTFSLRPTVLGSKFLSLYRKTVLLAITRTAERRETWLMMLSVIPSARYSVSGSASVFPKGRTASDSTIRRGAEIPAPPLVAELTGAINRYPRRASVSMNRGFPGASPNACRNLLTAAFRLCSKFTNVSAGQSSFRKSSRVIRSPGRSNSLMSTCTG